jgi:hypothetical protein
VRDHPPRIADGERDRLQARRERRIEAEVAAHDGHRTVDAISSTWVRLHGARRPRHDHRGAMQVRSDDIRTSWSTPRIRRAEGIRRLPEHPATHRSRTHPPPG